MSQTVLHRSINPYRVEQIYKRAQEWAFSPYPDLSKAEKGTRIAKAKDQWMMTALEKAVEILDRMAEDQTGATRRQASTEYAYKFEPSVVKAFKEAYRTAEDGCPAPQFGYLYAAVAEFAGLSI